MAEFLGLEEGFRWLKVSECESFTVLAGFEISVKSIFSPKSRVNR